MIDFNRAPYFDDYDEDKKFHRILFRPTFAVQARELNQQQTILQNQIARFGNHIFKNGAMVIPGQITFDNALHFAKLDTLYDSVEVALSLFLGYKVQGLTTGIVAEVINVADVTGTDPKTLFVKYLSSSTATGYEGQQTFIDGEILQRTDNTNYECKIIGTVVTKTVANVGKCSASSIEKGVYFINGNFVNVDKQSIITSKYTDSPSVKVGLRLYEYLVTPEEESSLLDNAQGSYNYAAPGAHRYKLDLLLEYIDVDADIPDDFIELQRIENGIIINEIRTSEYNELEKTFARRTYDESGDYTVSPFNLDIKEHLKNSSTRFKDGKYLVSDTPSGDETKLALGIEPGKAYVRGFERVKLATTWLETNKARTSGLNNNSVTNFNIGNYIFVKQCYKLPDISKFASLKLWDTASTDGATTGTQIGTAKVRAIELFAVNHGTSLPVDYVYKLYIFDIVLNTGYIWNQVLWISAADGASTFTCKTTIEAVPGTGTFANLEKKIINPTKLANIFKLPHQYIKTLKTSGNSDTSYTVQRLYTSVSVSGTTVSLTANTNETFDIFNGKNYIMMNLAAADSSTSYINLSSATIVINAQNITITSTNLSGVTNVRLAIPVIKLVSTERIKTQTNISYTVVTPNKVQGSFDELNKADGIRLISVIDSGDSSLDITSRYQFDTGQRDSFYDLARIKLKSDSKSPVGPLLVNYDYFSHTAGDFCSVDSYSTVDYYDIPVFYSDNGRYELSDCIDFRPVVDVSGDAFNGSGGRTCELPMPLSNIRADYEHYLSRIDKLYIDYTGKFSVIEGTPSVYPVPPKSPSDGMVLYEIFMTAYTYTPKEARPKFIDNKRYTMRDIGRLEKRINNLEYYSSLSLLEKETAQLQIKDTTGLDRYKNGFIVEPFISHGVGDAGNPDYKCSVDPVKGLMRPTFSSDSIALLFNETDSSNVVTTGPLVTLEYTSVPFISQSLASTTENVNPFAIRVFEGIIAFQPDSDNWYDTKHNGDLIVNDDAHYAALEFIATFGKGLNGVEWNAWQTLWSSSSSSSSTNTSTVVDRSRDHDDGQVATSTNTVTTTVTTTKQARTGSNTTHTPLTIDKFLGDRTVGINYIPYMRSIPVLVKVEMMKPSTRVYPFFDDVAVDAYVTPAVRVNLTSKTGTFSTSVGKEESITTSGGGTAVVVFESATQLTIVNWNGSGFTNGLTITGADSGATAVISGTPVLNVAGDDLITDEKGRIALVFDIPNNDTLRFRTGERQFVLNDQINNTESNQTKAEALFKSQGSLLQQEGTILSTKTIRFNRIPLHEKRTLVSVSESSSSSVGDWYDPLAQTFLIQEIGGCFVTGCDIYFRDKDASLPISFQIREVTNGYPNQTIVPYSEVTMYPESILTSEDGTVATRFNTQAPVYLRQGAEYCFVLLSDSFEYNIWIAEMGQLDVASDEMISKQPYNGVLFKSQNASTWTANQDQDIKFTLYKARFNVDNAGVPIIGTAAFHNASLSNDVLDGDPFETFNGSEFVRVHHFAHGFTENSLVTISGVALVNHNNIPGSELNGSHTVTRVELDSYVIEVTTPANFTGMAGGQGVTVSRNVQMDIMRPNIAELVLPGTFSSWGVKTLTSKSVNGNQTAYTEYPSTLGSYAGISIDENNFMNVPMMVASTQNETSFNSGNKSLRFLNLMQSDNRNISPVVDLARTACIAVGNRIDNPTTSSDIRVATTVNGTDIVSIAHIDHGMATGAMIMCTGISPIGGISALNLTGDFIITRLTDDSYQITAKGSATSDASGNLTVEHSPTHYLYMPENVKLGGSVAAKYQTNKITVENASIGFRVLITAVVMDKTIMEVWYKKQGPYDTGLFSDIEWELLIEPDYFVPLSENESDFREYTFSKELDDGDEFTSLAVKIIMKSTDSTKVPILDDLRVICLGT